MGEIFDDNIPIYLQLVKLFKVRIANGTWKIGSRVDSVRDLAVAFQVNPNTVQKALSEMEREKLVHAERTSGRYITGDVQIVRQIREDLAVQIQSSYITQMTQLGFDCDEVIEMTAEYCKKENKQDEHDFH